MQKLCLIFFTVCTFAFLATAHANESYLCEAKKVTSAAPPPNELNFSCDFPNDVFLHPVMGQMAKRTCEVQFKDKPLKLEIGNQKLIYFNGYMEKTFERFDHKDGIGGSLLSKGQYQHLLTFNPELKSLTAVSINPFMGTLVVISECQRR